MKRTIKYIIEQEHDALLIKQYLKKRGYTSSVLTALKKTDDGILLNGERAYVNRALHTADVLLINMQDDESSCAPEAIDVEILYEDDDIIVYNKPSDMVVHPTKKIQSGTLANAFYHHVGADVNCVYRPVYRLDKHTTGVVVVAKNKLACAILSANVKKKYICICEGKLSESGTFNDSIALSDSSKLKRCLSEHGQSAITHFRRIATNGAYSVASVWLETGRTHQIRVHFSGNGYALVGDFLYGNQQHESDRYLLHCCEAEFIHPVSGENICIKAQVPEDILKFLQENGINF